MGSARFLNQQIAAAMSTLLTGLFVLGVPLFSFAGEADLTMVVNGNLQKFDSHYASAVDLKTQNSLANFIVGKIENAQKNGISSIGTLNLESLKSILGEVTIVVIHEPAALVGSGPFSLRIGSVYLSDTKTLYLNENILKPVNDSMNPLLVHEFLGATGIDDQNYQVSLFLENPLQLKNVLKNNPNFNFSRQLLATPLNKSLKLLDRTSGGVTVIGGGGDDILFDAKSFMIKNWDRWQNWLATFPPDKLQQIQSIMAPTPMTDWLSAEKLAQFQLYFLQVPFEPMTLDMNIPNPDATTTAQLNRIVRVVENEKSPSYIRLSRDHWNHALIGTSLENSRMMITSQALMTLYMAWLIDQKER